MSTHKSAKDSSKRSVGIERRNLTRKAALCSAALIGVGSPVAFAAESTAGATDLQEVVVTATRRAETLRNVPLAISVLTADELQSSGAKSLGDFLYAVPGVNFAKDGRDNRGTVTIRGVTTGALSTPMVGNYVDEVPVGSSSRFADGIAAFDQRLLDLERIEVLKGPQGTLYGASSMGGTLRYITRRPQLNDTSGTIGLELSDTDNGEVGYAVNGVLNAALSDTTALRIAAFDTETSGFVDATGAAAGRHLNSSTARGGRVSLLWAPTDALRVTFTGLLQRTTQDGTSFVDYRLDGTPVVDEFTRANLRDREPQHQRNDLYSLDVEYGFGWASLHSISAYQKQNFTSKRDFGTIYGIFAGFFPPFVPITNAIDNREADLKKWSQEFRLVSQAGDRFDWLAGVFYTHEDGVLAQSIAQTYADGRPASPLLFGPGAGFDSTYKEFAFYATANFKPTSKLTLTGGVRAARNEQDVLQLNGGILAPGPNDRRSSKENPVTWLAAARYELTTTSNLYARVATGYRAGGPNLGLVDPTTGQPVAQTIAYDSDKLTSYEVGYKASLLDGALDVDLSAYWIDWKNIQQVVFRGGSAAISNFGNARIQGAELALTGRPLRWLQLGTAMSYIDAELRTDSPVGLQALRGSSLPYTAKFTANVFARAEFPIAAGARGYLRIDQLFQDDVNTSFDRPSTPAQSRPNFVLPSFQTTDLTIGVDFDRWTVGLYARNVFNESALLGADTTQAPFGGTVWATPIRPRTVGLTFTANF